MSQGILTGWIHAAGSINSSAAYVETLWLKINASAAFGLCCALRQG
jgi:hypothetical protein